jgi:AhpD family alkylhydroperoxidase
MLKLEGYIKQLGLDDRLYELIKIRASQINGCAYCLDMHTKDARAMGETEQRIYMLNACREAPFYTEAERAVMALTEAVTRISEGGVPQVLYEYDQLLEPHFHIDSYDSRRV